MKNILIAVAVLLVIIGGVFYYFSTNDDVDPAYQKPEVTTPVNPVVEETATTTEESPAPAARGPQTIIGESVNGETVTAYHFGDGDTEVLFIGGIHGGYSWNTALLAYELIDWLEATPEVVPEDVTVTIIPALNPDGLAKVTGTTGRFTAADVSATAAERTAARFNANDVDLNRNFDCEWKATGTWQNRDVSGGTKPFSEPETEALRTYVANNKPAAVIAWYSAAGGVYASSCNNGILPGTEALTNLFAKAANYTAHEEFDYYEITGDMVNWFASQNIPAISVLLSNHEQTELAKNKAGVEAVLKYLIE